MKVRAITTLAACVFPAATFAGAACDDAIHTWIDVLGPLAKSGPSGYKIDHSDVGDTDAQDWYVLGVAMFEGYQNDFDEGRPLPLNAAEVLLASDRMTQCLARNPRESYDSQEMKAAVRTVEKSYPRRKRLEFLELVQKQ